MCASHVDIEPRTRARADTGRLSECAWATHIIITTHSSFTKGLPRKEHSSPGPDQTVSPLFQLFHSSLLRVRDAPRSSGKRMQDV